MTQAPYALARLPRTHELCWAVVILGPNHCGACHTAAPHHMAYCTSPDGHSCECINGRHVRCWTAACCCDCAALVQTGVSGWARVRRCRCDGACLPLRGGWQLLLGAVRRRHGCSLLTALAGAPPRQVVCVQNAAMLANVGLCRCTVPRSSHRPYSSAADLVIIYLVHILPLHLLCTCVHFICSTHSRGARMYCVWLLWRLV